MNTKKNWEFLYCNNFVLLGQDPSRWLFQAQLLEKAAKIALKQVETDDSANVIETGWIDSVYKYLAGITIENLLKGIIIADHPTLVSKDKMDGSLGKHDPWTRHADKLQGVKELLKKDEKDVLKVLEHYVMWKGRYPTALTAKDYARDLLDCKKREPPFDQFKAVFETLYEKLSRELSEKVKDQLEKRGPRGTLWTDI